MVDNPEENRFISAIILSQQTIRQRNLIRPHVLLPCASE